MLHFTCGERRICSTIKKCQIMIEVSKYPSVNTSMPLVLLEVVFKVF